MAKVTLLTHTPMPEQTIAAAAKLCYSAAEIDKIYEGLTPEKTASFVEMLSEIGHESPIEHASFTFGIEGVSRSFLAQVTRHRMASFSVQSQRYVKENMFEYVLPPEIESAPEAREEYIQAMDRADLNVMSEFLVMAATLLDIKCKMLLPKEVNEEGEEEDPRAELVEKLLEYKMYKYMSFELRDMELDAAKSFYREKDVPREVEAYRPPLDYNELLKDMTLAKLQEIFEGILKRQEDKKDPVRSNFGRIEKDEVSVDQKAVYVEDFIRTHKRFSFRALLEKQHSKVEVIVTFLVVLELMKTGKITVEQASINDDMTVISREEQMA